MGSRSTGEPDPHLCVEDTAMKGPSWSSPTQEGQLRRKDLL